MSNEFRIDHEGALPAPPEVVWDAVTRDAGAWLMPDDGPGQAPVVWDPPRHAVLRESSGDWWNQIEFTVEPTEAGSFIRYVHSGIFVDDWENQYDGARRHTELYMHNLVQYLRYFKGRSYRHFEVAASMSSATPDALDAIRVAWGISEDTPAGTRLTVELPVAGPVDAELDFNNDAFIGLRTEDALYRVFGRNRFGGPVAIGGYQYGEQDQPLDDVAAAWAQWLADRYPVIA